jgi:hypothetical protein
MSTRHTFADRTMPIPRFDPDDIDTLWDDCCEWFDIEPSEMPAREDMDEIEVRASYMKKAGGQLLITTYRHPGRGFFATVERVRDREIICFATIVPRETR